MGSESTYQRITDSILRHLERGVVPWRQPWESRATGAPPRNVRGTPYRGVNVVLLRAQAMACGYTSPVWLTFRQARQLGGHVRRGEKGAPVVFRRFVERGERVEEADGETRERIRRVPLARLYHVFNVAQTEGTGLSAEAPERAPEPERIAAAEARVAAYPDPPRIEEGGDRAFYVPSRDLIQLPKREQFHAPERRYSTLLHELAHSTGHARRLAREGITDRILFGSHTYSFEELVAELAAAMLCGVAGIDAATVEASAAYVDHWRRRLSEEPRLILRAAAQAQRAADWIQGLAQPAQGAQADAPEAA